MQKKKIRIKSSHSIVSFERVEVTSFERVDTTSFERVDVTSFERVDATSFERVDYRIFVERELPSPKESKWHLDRHNLSLYPTIHDIRNHVYHACQVDSLFPVVAVIRYVIKS